MRSFEQPPRHRSTALIAAALLGAGTLAAVAVAGSAAATSPETVSLPSSGSVQLHGKGNGHGHGMSQYGAQGAALKRLTTRQILAFYYPGTRLTTLAASTIRVRLSGAGSYTTVMTDTPGLAVSGVTAALRTTGYRFYRLVPSGAGLGLQRKTTVTGAPWTWVDKTLPSRADFRGSSGAVHVWLAGSTSTLYRGTVGALRSGSGEVTINRVSLDGYTEGVVPREMPASWRPAAVGAQAVAARSYGRQAVETSAGDTYDICDTTQCQVYGGARHYTATGSLLYTDDPAAIVGNENQVLTYSGATIFAQFSASNGGATVAGSQPYLVGKVDPYDTTASGDPYLNWSRAVSVTSLASNYGLKRVTSVEITKRDGNGAFGGRVLSGYVNGLTSTGVSRHIATTGLDLSSAMSLPTSLFHFDLTKSVPAAPTGATAHAGDASAIVSWAAPSFTGNSPITGYRLTWTSHTLLVRSSARSAFVSPLSMARNTKVEIRAINAVGTGSAGAVAARGTPAPHRLVALPSARLFDTSKAQPVVDLRHPFRFDVKGKRGVPTSGAQSVQFALSILNPTSSGTLTVSTSGAVGQHAAAISYRAGSQITTATVSLQLQPSTVLVFSPSAGSVNLYADVLGYGTPSGSTVSVIVPHLVANVANTGMGSGTAVALNGMPGITSATTAVLLRVQGIASRATWVSVWEDGLPTPRVLQVAVGPGRAGVNTVMVPLSTSHRIRVASGAAGVGARITLLGVLQSTGAGLLETFPPNAIGDWTTASRPAVTVGTSALATKVVGVSQMPATGVAAVLVEITVDARGQRGALWAYANGTRKPTSPVTSFSGTGPMTATALVAVGGGGAIALQSSVPGVRVSIDAIGYVTAA